MMIGMMNFLLSLLVADWIMKDMSPSKARAILIGGAIVVVVGISILSGSVVCLVALAILAGIVGLNFFKKDSSSYR